MKRIIFVLFLAFLMAGCSSYMPLRDENRINIAKIDKGMTRAQVVQVMGEKSVGGMSGTVTNPYKREIIRDCQGAEYEILYYYTEQVGQKHWEEGMTPVILKAGQVVGIGWRYLETSDLNITFRRR